MERYVIDTNCLIMIISAKNGYNRIWRDFLAGKFEIVLSNDILEEYIEVIGRNLRVEIAEYVGYVLLNSANVIRVSPSFHFHLIEADSDDNKFVDCAVVGNAKLIVTNDKHFNELDKVEFPKVLHETLDGLMRQFGYQV